jgi:hypothetical protein
MAPLVSAPCRDAGPGIEDDVVARGDRLGRDRAACPQRDVIVAGDRAAGREVAARIGEDIAAAGQLRAGQARLGEQIGRAVRLVADGALTRAAGEGARGDRGAEHDDVVARIDAKRIHSAGRADRNVEVAADRTRREAAAGIGEDRAARGDDRPGEDFAGEHVADAVRIVGLAALDAAAGQRPRRDAAPGIRTMSSPAVIAWAVIAPPARTATS